MTKERLAILFVLFTALALPGIFAGQTWAGVQYLNDGAVQNTYGGFDLPLQGSCPAGGLNGYGGIDTRPECVALRLNIAQCSCVSPNYSWTTSGVCNDLANNNQGSCNLQPDRLWNPDMSICAIVMTDDDRNNVTCAKHGGSWVTTGTCVGSWIMPAGSSYTPPVLGTGTGPGDQCLRCHNTRTQYNSPRVRDTEDTMFMGHKNMSRVVVPGKPWGGPPFQCVGAFGTAEEECYDNGGNWVPVTPYPATDTGQTFDWVNGTFDHDSSSGTPDKTVYWIYGDWLSALPRAIYNADPNTVPNPDTPGVSYSCARCHTTGWTSDTTINYGVGGSSTSTREPEKTFPGITWNGTSDAHTGQVNLAGGVTGDTNKMASWDVFGITCSRCHSSAINRTTTDPSGFSAPTGMSSHHSDLTAPDVSTSGDKGYCSDTRFTTLAVCNQNRGAWLTACSKPGICSNSSTTSSGECTAGGGSWTSYNSQSSCLTNGGTWYGTGCVGDATLTTQAACQGAGKTWFAPGCSNSTYVDQTTCESNNAVWSDPRCTISGVCNNSLYTDAVSCKANGAQWQATTDVIRCGDAEGRWTGSKANRGQLITALCMNCHRQETGGLPYGATNSGGVINYSLTNPAGQLKVGVNHGTVAFLSHPHGNQFLNSPHGKFSGTFDKIALGTFNYAMTGEYKSFFMVDGEAANTGNGCTGCHEVHNSTVTGEKPFREECTECHAKDLTKIMHPSGGETPIHLDEEPMEACVTCHMPNGQHSFRINTSASYSTYPIPAAFSGTQNANTSPDGTYSSAVWVDLNAACGQCHGGGMGQATATVSNISAGDSIINVGDASAFTVGERIRIPGAGALYYDDTGVNKLYHDLDAYIKAKDATTLTLTGPASANVTNVLVTQNAISHSAPYMTKTTLASYAKGIHNDKPQASFTYSTNGLTANVNASASTCSGSNANCNAYAWEWGDGQTGSGVTASHTYATAGTKSIKLTVTQYGVGSSSLTKNVNVYATDTPPVVSSNYNFDSYTWIATLNDTSTDNLAVTKVTVAWGDGSATETKTVPPFNFTHTYKTAGNFTITHRAYDVKGQSSAETKTANPAYLFINGTIYKHNGTTPVSSVTVQLKINGVLQKTVYSNSVGAYSATSLKPGIYTLTLTKTGYVFPAGNTVNNPNVQVGPSKSGNNINATSP